MLDTDLAWLGGIWDGEGSICLFQHKSEYENKIKPIIVVVNTDLSILNKIRKILEEIGCKFVLTERKKIKAHHKLTYTFSTSNSKYIKLFLENVLPHIHGEKQAKGEILLAYISQRMDKMERIPSKGSTPYDDKDWAYLEQFRSSSTTREAATADDIVSLLGKP